MNLKLLNKSEVVEVVEEIEIKNDEIEKIENFEEIGKEKIEKKLNMKDLEIISPGRIIECERRDIGLIGNCVLCQGINKEIFGRCKNRWTDY